MALPQGQEGQNLPQPHILRKEHGITHIRDRMKNNSLSQVGAFVTWPKQPSPGSSHHRLFLTLILPMLPFTLSPAFSNATCLSGFSQCPSFSMKSASNTSSLCNLELTSFLSIGSLRGRSVKGFACKTGDAGSIPGSGRSARGGNGNPLQDSCWENPMDRGSWWALVHGVTKSLRQLSH